MLVNSLSFSWKSWGEGYPRREENKRNVERDKTTPTNKQAGSSPASRSGMTSVVVTVRQSPSQLGTRGKAASERRQRHSEALQFFMQNVQHSIKVHQV